MNKKLWIVGAVLCGLSLSGCWFVPIPGTGWGLVGVPLPRSSSPPPRHPPLTAEECAEIRRHSNPGVSLNCVTFRSQRHIGSPRPIPFVRTISARIWQI